jgi:flavin reductase (DIM6/NTAB) family NADH-FMN oxidoreductase RutF
VAIEPTLGVAGSAEALQQVMRQFASGVTVVTALRQGIKHAMTATAVCSVSLVPPLILVCVSRSSRFHEAVTVTDAWCVSLLSADQERVARHFANKGRDLLSQFDHVPYRPSPLSGTPLIDGALAWMECVTYGQYDGGDHTIMVGELVHASGPPSRNDRVQRAPLTYYQGTYSPNVRHGGLGGSPPGSEHSPEIGQ